MRLTRPFSKPINKIRKHLLSRPKSATTSRLPVWQRRCFYGVSAALFGSGGLWIAVHFFFRPVNQFGVGVHPLEPWSMKLHGATAMLALWLVGSMYPLHIQRGLAAGRNRLAGWSLILILSWLVITGYALYYIAGEESRPVWSALHWSIGLLVPIAVWHHVRRGRKTIHANWR